LPISTELFITVFGTGRAAVGFDEITTRGCATAFASLTRSELLTGNPKLALPSVTGIGGKLDTSTARLALGPVAAGSAALSTS
jgi:hypothetical protein